MSAENKVIRAANGEWTPEVIAPAVKCLAEGAVVAFPTETVYGIGVQHGDSAAGAALNRLKGRDEDRPLTVHLSSVASIEEHAGPLSPLAQRLVDSFMPGPLTLLLDGQGEGEIVGVRVPNHPVATLLIREAGGAVDATSANATGDAPALEPSSFDDAMHEAVACTIDAGPAPLGRDSTIVRPVGDVPQIVRASAIPEESIHTLAGPVVLLVCTGNTCRSPMASVILRRLLAERLATTRSLPLPPIWSAGTGAIDGYPASENAILAMRERGLDLTEHRSSRLTPPALTGADFILTMTASAAATITDYFPELAPRIAILNGEAGGIPDPFGGDLPLYRDCATAITKALEDFLRTHIPRFEDGVE